MQKNNNVIRTCLSIDCPERFSLCCHAGSRSASEPEILLGVPAYFCAKCGKEFKGGVCTAGEKELPSIIELTERIVIDFANLTGRETESRAEFRALVYKHLEDFVNDFENRLEEYRNSPDVWKHVGVSKWRNWGEKCGYFDYLSGK